MGVYFGMFSDELLEETAREGLGIPAHDFIEGYDDLVTPILEHYYERIYTIVNGLSGGVLAVDDIVDELAAEGFDFMDALGVYSRDHIEYGRRVINTFPGYEINASALKGGFVSVNDFYESVAAAAAYDVSNYVLFAVIDSLFRMVLESITEDIILDGLNVEALLETVRKNDFTFSKSCLLGRLLNVFEEADEDDGATAFEDFASAYKVECYLLAQ